MQTDPYPWPFDLDEAPLVATSLAVVVCGWQSHWTTTVAWVDDPPVVLARITDSIDALRRAGATVVWVRHSAPSATRRPTPLPLDGTPAVELLDGPLDGDVVIDTPGFDAFLVERTDLELRGRGLHRLVMCGLGTETVVSSTTRSANDRGYECLTAIDACVHHDPQTGAHQLSSITMSGGIFGTVGRLSELVETLHLAPPAVASVGATDSKETP